MHASRSKAKGLSATSSVELQAEVAERTLDATRAKADGKGVGQSKPDLKACHLIYLLKFRGSSRNSNSPHGQRATKALNLVPRKTFNWRLQRDGLSVTASSN